VKTVGEEEVQLREIGFVKQVGFKPGVKERGKGEVTSQQSMVTIRSPCCTEMQS